MSGITDFLGRAIATVKKAVDADNAKDYQKALTLYTNAIELFILAAKWEKNAKSKETIREKANEYMERAEKLKVYLSEGEKNASNGTAASKGGTGPAGKKEKAIGGLDEDTEKLRNALKSIVVTDKPNVRFDDVAGLEEAKTTLKESVKTPLDYPFFFKGKRQPWRGILMYGPPGTGKSYLAKAVATEAGSTFFNVKSSDLVSKWMGESEKLIKQLFEMAREAKPAVIFIDEIDALCSARGEGGESEASRRIKTEFLVQMEGVDNNNQGLLVLAATNIPWGLDLAMRRRFQRVVHIGLPSAIARRNLLKMAVGDTPNTIEPEAYDFLADGRPLWPVGTTYAQWMGYLAQRTPEEIERDELETKRRRAKLELFSGSDITNAVSSALMAPVRRFLTAEHFMKVNVDGAIKYQPCSSGTPGAIEMSIDQVPKEDLDEAKVTHRDLEIALLEAHPVSNKDSLAKYDEWTMTAGSSGS